MTTEVIFQGSVMERTMMPTETKESKNFSAMMGRLASTSFSSCTNVGQRP